MTEDDIIKKYSRCPYGEPEFTELYNFSEKEIQKYCEWIRRHNAPIANAWDIDKNTYWTAKYYLATKYLFISNLFMSSYSYAKDKNLKIVLPYLIYYSLLTVSRALILTSPRDDKPINFVRSHKMIITETADIIAKLNFNKGQEYLKTINNAKINRELFSYKFPASGLNLINEDLNKILKQVNLIKELAILNSEILSVKLDKIKDKTVFYVDGSSDSILYDLFEYGDKLDNNDYNNAGYIGTKIQRPMPLNFMISEGIEDDLYLNWAPDNEDGDLYIPPLYIFN